jgi:hypothetical protein
MNSNQARNLLDELAAKWGICLLPPARNRIINCPPPTIDRFTDVVMRAEGMNPSDIVFRRQLRERVAAHFDAAEQSPPRLTRQPGLTLPAGPAPFGAYAFGWRPKRMPL